MKILHLTPYIPAPPQFGGALRIYHILKYLTTHHEVTLAGFGNFGSKKALLDDFPSLKGNTHFSTHPWRLKFKKLIQFYSLFTDQSAWKTLDHSKKNQDNIDRLVASEDFDIVQAEFPSMGFFDIKSDAVKILDAHNVEYDNFRRMANMDGHILRRWFYQKEYEKLYKEELEVCRKQDAVFTTSNRDKELFDKDVPEVPKFVIPNGVDLEYFSAQEESDDVEPDSLVFVGMMGYVPNYDAMNYFLDDILPLIRKKRPDIKLYIVGKRPPNELVEKAKSEENVTVTGFVEDVRPYVVKSAVYVVPLRMGGGTRLKVLEALAMEKPLVTTGIGCEGIDVEHEKSALIANNPEEFSEAVLRLLDDRKLRKKLQYNGYELVRQKYAWSVIGDYLEDAYQQLLKNPERRAKTAS